MAEETKTYVFQPDGNSNGWMAAMNNGGGLLGNGFIGSSLPDEQHLAMYVKDYIDDPDQADGFVFNRFFADCVLKGIPIDWEDMI